MPRSLLLCLLLAAWITNLFVPISFG